MSVVCSEGDCKMIIRWSYDCKMFWSIWDVYKVNVWYHKMIMICLHGKCMMKIICLQDDYKMIAGWL
jgi:hypothetical protein